MLPDTPIKPILFKPQMPVPDMSSREFKETIEDRPVKCKINGAKVYNPNQKNVTIDVSFNIQEELKVLTYGLTPTGRATNDAYTINAKDKNVTLNFELNKTDKKLYGEILNYHELYNITRIALVQKNLMDEDDQSGIFITYDILESCLKGTILKISTNRYDALNYEVISEENEDD